MTSNSATGRSRAKRWLGRGLAAFAVATVAAIASLAGSASAHAQEWQTIYDFTKTKFAARHNLGQSDAPEVAQRSRRARAAIVRSDDDDAPRARRTRTRTARAKISDDGGSDGTSSRPKVGGGHVAWVASGGCLPGELRSVIAEVSRYGRVVVSSTGRSHSHNASVGGARGSYHLSCQAADFRVHGNVASAASFLRNHGSVGGFHHYGGGLFHIDTGPKRSW